MTESLGAFRAALEAKGPPGLDFLNARVPHRYTGIYALVDGVLHNLHLHDKLGEMRPEFLATVPLQDSFCQFVLRDGVFATSDSGTDRRLDGHKYQGALLAYHGVPLLDDQGQLFGTLCHFDTAAHGLSDDELAFMREAARELPRHLRRG